MTVGTLSRISYQQQYAAHRLGLLVYKLRRMFWFTRKSVGPNSGGVGSNLNHNVSPNTTKFFTHVLTYVFYNNKHQRRIQILQTKFRMGEINDNLFHCSAHLNTRKTCWDISVDRIIHCRPSYALATQRYLVSTIFFSEKLRWKGLSLGLLD